MIQRNNYNNSFKQINKFKQRNNYIQYDGPCLSTITLNDLEWENASASLKINKSSGNDDISANVVKKVSEEIFVILKHIFSISLAKWVFPDSYLK